MSLSSASRTWSSGDVRRRVGERDRVALLDLAALGVAGARVQREEHVPQAGQRAHQDRRVLVDRQGVAIDVEGDHGAPVDQFDLGDVADPDAGNAKRLALPGDDALGVLELGLELEGLLLEHRDPEALLLEDVVADRPGDGDQPHDREEVREVLADRGHHGAYRSSGISAPTASASASAAVIRASSIRLQPALALRVLGFGDQLLRVGEGVELIARRGRQRQQVA